MAGTRLRRPGNRQTWPTRRIGTIDRRLAVEDSMNPLMLEGWDDQSIWGYDSGTASHFAQLTRNGNSDAAGPDVWITPPNSPVLLEPAQLAGLIAQATGHPIPTVVEAMNHGQVLAEGIQ
jgi:hypothetical protein